MTEMIKELLLALLLAGVFALLAAVLKARKQYILALVTSLIQKAEASVSGSEMGAEKKRLVIAQLEAMNIRVTAGLSQAIDEIVAALNEKRAWFTEVAKDTLSETAAK